MHSYEVEQLAATVRRPAGRSGQNTGPSAVLTLQRLAGNESVDALLTDQDEAPSPVHQVVGRGGGSPLETSTRTLMEERLGADFSDVRVHTGSGADASAQSINAHAYTVGTDVVFRSGTYEPETPAGRHVLAHELAHVIQQRSGPVDGTPAPGGIRLSDPADPFEKAAERTAADAVSGPAAVDTATAPTAGVQRSEDEQAVQRAAEDEQEEAVQTLAVQRAEEDEEELPPA